MNWRKKIIIMVLTLILTIPMITFANNDFNVLDDKSFEKRQNYNKNDQRKEIPEEVRIKIKELKTKLKTGEIDKEQFHKELKKLFPEKTHFKKRCYKDLPADVRVKLKDLKTKLLNGEITEDQFHKEIDKIMPQQYKYRDIKKDSLKKSVE